MLTHIKNVHEKEPETPKKITGGKCKFCNEVNFFIPLMPEFWSYIQHFELFFKYIFHSLTTCSTIFSLKNYFKLSCFNAYFFCSTGVYSDEASEETHLRSTQGLQTFHLQTVSGQVLSRRTSQTYAKSFLSFLIL